MPDAMIDVHLHLPAGAQKKDGPSAGVAMVSNPLLKWVIWCQDVFCRSARSYPF
jgi:Lon protease (S16) C-terminal proteolytic domain